MITTLNRTIVIGAFALFAILTISQPRHLSAQQYYKALKKGEYEVVEEKIIFNPGAKIGGSYELIASDRKEGFVTGSSLGGKFYQDISLSFESKINTNVSVNLEVGHQSSDVSDQDRAYDTEYASESPENSGGQGFNLRFNEAYLEYNHNPNAQLRIGRQAISMADRLGLVFEGEATAISQGCRIGTWCYSIGGARLGEEGSSGVFWAQLDYPVYESGVLIKDPWGVKPTRQERSFSVELFRVMYGGNNIPLAEYGGWTGEYSDHHDTVDDTVTGDPVYFDNDGVEYIGLNVIWNHYDFDLHVTWSNMSGSRDYFSKNKTSGQEAQLGSKSVSGNAYLLDAGYRLTEEWKSTLRVFSASGDEKSSDSEKIWEIDSDAYYEIQKGSFGDALIYFNGKNGIGDGHSVSNLTFYALKFSYQDREDTVSADLDVYTFSRTNPVFTNEKGGVESTSQDIGLEADFRVSWRLEESLSFQFFAAYFQPGSAYVENDSLRPESSPQTFSLLGVSGRYTF